MAVLSVKNLSVRFEDADALDDVSFEVEQGASVAVIGPNGAGKSTLMRAISGLLQPMRGSEIVVDRKRLGYVPQQQSVDWSFPVTVYDVVLMGLARQIGWFKRAGREQQQRVHAALAQVGLTTFATRQIGELSGGQKQRVFVARALAQQADILLLDEPFAGVDVSAQNDLLAVLDDLHAAGMTFLLSTHDLNLAFQRFQQVMAINERLIAFDTPAAVYTTETLLALYGSAMATIDGQMVIIDE